MKKIISMLLAAIVFLSVVPAFAEEEGPNDLFGQVAEIMSHYAEDPVSANTQLAELQVVLDGEPHSVDYINPSIKETSQKGINPTDYTLSVYSFSRGGSLHYIQWEIESNRAEWFYQPLDYVSIEWDTHVASYYSSSGDSTISTVQGTNTGIVLFNVEDQKLKKGKMSYGTVGVHADQNGALNYGSKYVHTYSDFLVTGTASTSYSPSFNLLQSGDFSLGLTYTFGFTVNVSTQTSKWQIWADNTTWI